MANASKRFYGEVGYLITEIDDYGVAKPTWVKRNYYGNVEDLTSRWQDTEHFNDDISVSHRINILADPYATRNFPYIKYVEWMGTKWDVKSIKVEYPRLLLSLGGVYNGQQT